MKFSRLGLGLVALAALATAVAGIAQAGPGPAGPAPVEVAQLGATPVPTSAPKRGRRGSSSPGPSPSASPTDSPPPLQFSNLDGVWEIEVQPVAQLTKYSHLSLRQDGTTLNGYWERDPNSKTKNRFPLTGSFDGRLFALTVDLGEGKTATMSGYAENFSDFVGMLRVGPTDPGTPFTGQHRKKERPT